jgi:ATP-dependent helicase/nuclease subunit B
MKRIFFDWSEPMLPQAAAYLLAKQRASAVADLSQTIVVTNVSSAGRRLLELLVQQAEAAGLMLMPPTITTVGALPEMLYRPKWPFADAFVQRLAWAEALKRTPSEVLQQVVPHPPAASDDRGWLELGQLFRGQHIELAADRLNFEDVVARGAELSEFPEADRWRAMGAVQLEYHKLLDSLELWDRQTARLVALEKREYGADRDVVVIGAVDLNRTMRAILDAVGERVSIFVHAPERLADRFDSHGCLQIAAWENAEISIDDETIQYAGGPADQAEALAQTLAGYDGRYAAEEITVGLPNEGLASQVERRLAEAGIATRWIGGKTTGETGPLRLLTAIADYLEFGRFQEFAALVRHPDIYDAIARRMHGRCYLMALDEYANEHLGGRAEGEESLGWLGDQAVRELLAALPRENLPLSAWQATLRKLLLAVYDKRIFDRRSEADRLALSAARAVAAAMEALAGVPEKLSIAAPAAQILRWVHREIADDPIPPEEGEPAVQLMGWLELALDDAPALVVTSFNEGFVPSSRVADAFLPDRLRSRLGLDDNSRRYARDAYAASVLVHSRRDLTFIVGRRDREGNSLAPSRLLFAVKDEMLAARATASFGEAPATRRGGVVATSRASDKKWLGFPPLAPSPTDRRFESLAVSDFKNYLRCPYRFYLQRVLGLEPLSDDVSELDGRSFGNLAHAVLDAFGLDERRHSTDPAELRALFDALLEKEALARFGRTQAASIRLQTAQLKARLAAFANKQAERSSEGWRIEAVERPFDGDDEAARLIVDDSPIGLRGRIDRVDFHPREGRAIFDYKTGDAGDGPEKSHRKQGQWIDLQLPLYRHVGIGMGMDPARLKVGYILLGRKLDKIKFEPAPWGAADFAEAERTAQEVVRGIRQHVFWPPTKLDSKDRDDYSPITQHRRFGRWTADENESECGDAHHVEA